MTDPNVICVVGMHRCGTSAVSRILNLLGFSLGPAEKLMPPTEFNPTGHWEHRPFVDINDEILAMYGGSWDRPPAFPDGWHRSTAMAPFQERARRTVQEDFPAGLPWAWKDPRTCLTLPFWQELLPSTRYVVCLRNPLDVALSLQRRDGFSLIKGGDLWLRYLASAILNTSGLPRLLLFYEDLMLDWKPEVRRLAAFLGDQQILKKQEAEKSIDDFVDRSLKHYRSLPEEILAERAIPFPARALHFMLQNHSARRPEDSDSLRGEARDTLLERFAGIALEEHVGSDHHLQLEESQHRVEMLRATLADRDRLLAEMDHTLNAIRQSRSWRFTGVLRWLSGWLRSLIDRR